MGWFAPKGWGGEVALYKGREEGLTCAGTVVPSGNALLILSCKLPVVFLPCGMRVYIDMICAMRRRALKQAP